MRIRQVKNSDLESVHALNETALPHVNSISISEFERFMKISSFFLVIEEEGEVAGFMIVLPPGQLYESENYRYFSSKYDSFDYVDRIVIGEKFRGRGLGSKLYNYLFENSKEERISCEVNIKPPNPKSIQFHQMMGFDEVSQQFTGNGKKYVSLMIRESKG